MAKHVRDLFCAAILFGIAACSGAGTTTSNVPFVPSSPGAAIPNASATANPALIVGIYDSASVSQGVSGDGHIVNLGFRGNAAAIAVDSHNTLFASAQTGVAFGDNAVNAYSAGSSTATNTFANSAGTREIMTDSSDAVYIVQPDRIMQFAPGEFTIPVRILPAPAGLHFGAAGNPRLTAVDEQHNVYALASNDLAGCTSSEIVVFGASGETPKYSIAYTPPSPAGMTEASIAVDSTGELYVAGQGVGEPTFGFAPGTATPNLTLPSAYRVAIGPDDAVYLLELTPDASDVAYVRVSEFAARSTTLLGSTAKKLGFPGNALAVDRNGGIYYDIRPENNFILMYSSIASAPVRVDLGLHASLKMIIFGPP